MNRIHFDTLELAVEHAKQHGGWIWNDGGVDVQWFDACRALSGCRWTPSEIMAVALKGSGGGVLAPWDSIESMTDHRLSVGLPA